MLDPIGEWHPIATVVRSHCHNRTWVGHVMFAGYEDTPAGPLRVVKDACVEMAVKDEETYRWRHSVEEDTWTLEVFTDDL